MARQRIPPPPPPPDRVESSAPYLTHRWIGPAIALVLIALIVGLLFIVPWLRGGS